MDDKELGIGFGNSKKEAEKKPVKILLLCFNHF